MIFSSTEFLFFLLPVTIVLFYLFWFSRTCQNLVLLVASLIFYMWMDPRYFMLFLGVAIIDWLLGFCLCTKNTALNKLCLIMGCLLNSSILIVFVYSEFITGQINEIGERELVPVVSPIVPVAISFFILQSLSYLIDVYKTECTKEKNPLNVLLYLFFFPKMIYGPLVQYSHFKKEIKDRTISSNKTAEGIGRILLGYLKYIFFIRYLGSFSEVVFNWSEFGTSLIEVSALTAWLGIIAYFVYVYFFYSAFSDFAIGFSRLFGFSLVENFDYPYQATTISGFWEKWNISLINWFRRYVYRIADENKVNNKDLIIKRLFIMWIFVGIWHGASWNAIFWGVANFLFLLTEGFFKIEENPKKLVKHVYTVLVVMMGWILLNTKTLYHAAIYYKNLFCLNNNSFVNTRTLFLLKEYGVIILIGFIICFVPWKKVYAKISKVMEEKVKIGKWISIVMIVGIVTFSVINIPFSKIGLETAKRHFGDISSIQSCISWIDETSTNLNSEMALADLLVEADGIINKCLGKNVLDDFQILVDDKGMMYQGTIYNEPLNDIDEITRQTYLLDSLVKSYGGELIVFVPPSKYMYGFSSLDSNLPVSDKNPAMDKYFSQLQQRQVDYIDFRKCIKKSGLKQEDLFFKTDHRWKPFAAFLATKELIKHVDEKYNVNLDEDGYYTDFVNYEMDVYKDSVIGTYGRRTGVIYGGYDSMEIIYPLNYQDSDYTVVEVDDSISTEVRGNLREALYINDEEMKAYFEHQTKLLLPYLGELHSKDLITNNTNPDGLKVAVIGDYYFAPMACYMAPMCSKLDIYSIRESKMQKEFVKAIRQNEYDLVILEFRNSSLKQGTLSFFEEKGH